MSLEKQYNMNNPSVKRIMREIREMEMDTNPHYKARPLEENLFEWHFTIRGPRETDFEGGIYHGRISLPSDYPFKPPNIILLTPNGRFEVGKKICLSISAHHPEFWQPGWSVRTVLIALIGFMPTKGDGAIGALDFQPEERRSLAQKSKTWKCESCGCDNATALPPEDLSQPMPTNDIPSATTTSSPSTPTTPTSSLNTSGETKSMSPAASQPTQTVEDRKMELPSSTPQRTETSPANFQSSPASSPAVTPTQSPTNRQPADPGVAQQMQQAARQRLMEHAARQRSIARSLSGAQQRQTVERQQRQDSKGLDVVISVLLFAILALLVKKMLV